MRRMQHIHPLLLAGLVILTIIVLSAWLDSQDANDARMAKKISPIERR